MIQTGLTHPKQCLATHHLDTIEKTLTKKEVTLNVTNTLYCILKATALAEFDGDLSTLGKAERFVFELSKIPW